LVRGSLYSQEVISAYTRWLSSGCIATRSRQIANWTHCEDLFHVLRRLACHIKGHPVTPSFRKDLQRICCIIFHNPRLLTKEAVMNEVSTRTEGMLLRYSRPLQRASREVASVMNGSPRRLPPIHPRRTQRFNKVVKYLTPPRKFSNKAHRKHSR